MVFFMSISSLVKKTSLTLFSGSIIFLIALGTVRSLILRLKKSKSFLFLFFLTSSEIKSSFCNLVIMCEPSCWYNYFKENGSFPRIDFAGTCCTNFKYFKMFVFDFSCISSETNILFFDSVVSSLIFFGSFSTTA